MRAPERRPEPVPWFPHRGGVSRSAVPTSRDACGLTSCSPETQSRQGTVPSGRSLPALNALGPKPLGTGCSIGAEGASVKLYFSTFDQQDMHTFINNVDNFFLNRPAFSKIDQKQKAWPFEGPSFCCPLHVCTTESSSERALGRKSGSTRSLQDRQLSPSTQLSITVFSP